MVEVDCIDRAALSEREDRSSAISGSDDVANLLPATMVGLSDPAMEEALYNVPLYREFAGLDGGMTRLPDETTILRFRHLLEAHGIPAQILAVVNELLNEKGLMLKTGSAVDATLIAAPSSTKNGLCTRDPEMQSIQKGRN